MDGNIDKLMFNPDATIPAKLVIGDATIDVDIVLISTAEKDTHEEFLRQLLFTETEQVFTCIRKSITMFT